MPEFTQEDMRRFAREAWGSFGAAIVDQWEEFNAHLFDGELRPVPLVITNTMPFGKRIAFCSYSPGGHGRTITLNVPKFKAKPGTVRYELLADNDTLLHEMVHQFLFERGEDPAHAGEPWRREIMRLNLAITGKPIWAGASRSVRVRGENGEGSRVIRANAPSEDGRESLTQARIARWPHDTGTIDFGPLGQEAL
jgi:hypothetical protein